MSAPRTMAAPYEVRLDPNTAREFAERGGAILMLDVPAGTSMSVDHQASRSSQPGLRVVTRPLWTKLYRRT